MYQDVRAGRLKTIDLWVYGELLSLRIRRRDSCWCAKRTMAGRVRKTERTVQSSWARLKAAGWLEHEQVETPDPDEPCNVTGWRFYFPREVEKSPSPPRGKEFLPPPPQPQAEAPDRRPSVDESFSETPISPKQEPFEADEQERTTLDVGISTSTECPQRAPSGSVAPSRPISSEERPSALDEAILGRLTVTRGPYGPPRIASTNLRPLDARELRDVRAYAELHGVEALADLVEARRELDPSVRPGGAGEGSGESSTAGPRPVVAPPIPKAAAEELRRTVRALGHDKSPAALEAAVAAAVRALPGEAAKTERFYRIALQLFQRGRLAEATVDTALRRALDGSPENRAAVFIAAIKQDPAMSPASRRPPNRIPHHVEARASSDRP